MIWAKIYNKKKLIINNYWFGRYYIRAKKLLQAIVKGTTYNRKWNKPLWHTKFTQLNNDETNLCEGLLTEHECTESLNDMGLNKSLGSDGITVEIYKAFWDILKTHYVNSINLSFQNQSLTELQKQGLISLIPKSRKDLKLLTNWRPI